MIAIDLRDFILLDSSRTHLLWQDDQEQYCPICLIEMNLIGCKSSSFGNFLFQKHNVGRSAGLRNAMQSMEMLVLTSP